MNRVTGIRSRVRALATALLTAIAVVGSIIVPATLGATSAASAAVWPTYTIDVSKFNAGQIITDDLFFDSQSMTAAQVQSFLNEKVPVCDPGYTCLKSKKDTTKNIPANPMCSAYTGAGTETAAAIIYKVGVACGISQKVILVTLEKEQGLVSDTWPSSRQYKYAMGADCPDSGDGCGLTAGFFQQVYRGAYMMKRYTQPKGTGPGTAYSTDFAAMHRVKTNVWVRYGVDVSCGSKKVYISNQATHVLYVYTPYTPNDAALKAGWGTAACGAYGNRNFFRYYFRWFGDPNGLPPKMSTPPDQTGDAVGAETVGTVLSVDAGVWTGNPKPSTSYQWYACGAPVSSPMVGVPAGCAAIAGATGMTYALTAADVGKYVAPLIIKSNQVGTATRMTVSTAFVYQAPANTAAPTFATPARPNQTVTVNAGAWSGLPAPTYSYKWLLCPTPTQTSKCVTVKGATGASVTPKKADLGKFYIAQVNASNRVTVAAMTSSAVQIQALPELTKHYVMTGKAAVSSKLTVKGGTWKAVPAGEKSYEFFACAAKVTKARTTLPDGCVSLAPATNSSKFVIPVDATGKYVVAKITHTNVVGPSVDVTASTTKVGADASLPVVAGTFTLGQTLTAQPGQWAGVKTPIPLTLTGPKFDKVYPIYAIQEALAADGYKTPRTGKYDKRTIADVKKYQAKHKLGLVDGLVGAATWKLMKKASTTTPATFTYQWLRCTNALITRVSAAPADCVPIPGATANTYVLAPEDQGKFVVIQITADSTASPAKQRWSLTPSLPVS